VKSSGSVAVIFFSFLFLSITYAQIPQDIQRFREDAYGNFRAERESIVDGNLIRTLFKNTGEIGHWPFQPSGEWPRGSGQTYLDGLTILLGAEVTAPGNGQIIHPIEASYRERMDSDPVTGEIWGLEPIPGYSNPSSTKPAMSSDPNSLPTTWSAALDFPSEYNGKFPGYFGLNSNKAFETFFVMDDSRDKEFTKAPYSFFPILSDTNRGGLGLRITTRYLQFRDIALENVLFMNYDITNISDFDYSKFTFGCYIDPGVGGPSSGGDDVRYDTALELVYAWDHLGRGVPGNWITGYIGFEFLETPSNSMNGIDDDEDGMIDERQDDGIDNDNDWNILKDDIGVDGIANTNDSGEGDGIPTNGEPNFDGTDKHESDQIGLNACSLTELADSPTNPWPKNDEAVWSKMVGGFADTSITNTNVNILFSSGPFPFPKYSSQRIASAILLGQNLQDLKDLSIVAKQAYNGNFNFVNEIGNSALTVTKPAEHEKVSGILPIQYSLSNFPGSVRYYIYHFTPKEGWTLLGIDENKSGYFNWQTNTTDDGVFHRIEIDAVTNYSTYRFTTGFFTVQNNPSSKPEIYVLDSNYLSGGQLQNIKHISFLAGDADGDSCKINFYYKPTQNSTAVVIASNMTEKDTLFTWDTRNFGNTKEGQLIGQVISGSDTGSYSIQNIWIENERILPTNKNFITGRKALGTGDIELHVVNLDQLSGDEYTMVFDSTYENGGSLFYKLYNKTKENLFLANVNEIMPLMESPIFDGLRIEVKNDTLSKTIKESETGWKTGGSNANLIFSYYLATNSWNGVADYEISFFDHLVDTSYIRQGAYVIVPVNFSIINITQNHRVKFAFADPDRSGTFTLGDEILIIEFDNLKIKLGLRIFYGGGGATAPPDAGSVLRIVQQKPFVKGDTLTFTTDKLVKVNDEKSLPQDFSLSQNYPNPFNPSTMIRFAIPKTSLVKIIVYDFLGTEVATLINREMNPGSYEVDFNGKTFASGVYFVRMEAGNFTQTKKVVLLK